MSRSVKDRQTSGRRQNGEEEPFLVEEISGSPVMRGRRQNSAAEERFVVENIPRSPVMRGRRRNSPEEALLAENISESPARKMEQGRNIGEESLSVQNMSASPATRGRRKDFEEKCFLIRDIPASPTTRGRGSGSTSTSEDPASNVPSSRIESPARPKVASNPDEKDGPPDNEDAPPSYESSLPPTVHVGWTPDVTSGVPFPMPYSTDRNDERLRFAYPPTSPSPSIELSPLAKSYLSIESPNSRSLGPSLSGSPCPSPDRLRPAYAYQQRPPVRIVKTPMRPRVRRDYENDKDFAVKPHNEFSYKYGGILIAIFFIVFLMILSIAVKFLIRKSFNQ